MAQHSKTPWSYDSIGQIASARSDFAVIAEVRHFKLNDGQAMANAAFIVQAANNFEALRDAADEALNTLIGCCVPAGGCDDRKTILDTQMRLRKVLAACGVSYADGDE